MSVGPGNGSPPRLRVDGELVPEGFGVELVWRAAEGWHAYWMALESGPTGGSHRLGLLPPGSRVERDGRLIHVEGAMQALRMQDLAPVGVADPSGLAVGEFCRECGADRGEACHSRCPCRVAGPSSSCGRSEGGDPPPVSGSEVRDSVSGASGGARAHGASSGRDERMWRLRVDEDGKRWVALSGTGWPGEHGLTRGEIDETMELVSLERWKQTQAERDELLDLIEDIGRDLDENTLIQ